MPLPTEFTFVKGRQCFCSASARSPRALADRLPFHDNTDQPYISFQQQICYHYLKHLCIHSESSETARMATRYRRQFSPHSHFVRCLPGRYNHRPCLNIPDREIRASCSYCQHILWWINCDNASQTTSMSSTHGRSDTAVRRGYVVALCFHTNLRPSTLSAEPPPAETPAGMSIKRQRRQEAPFVSILHTVTFLPGVVGWAA